MTDRAEIAKQAAKGLRRFADNRADYPAMVGFDGFVDSIITVVDKRHDADRYESVETIQQFGHKVLAAVGKSANFELVVNRQKLGGNGPIMANALAAIGLPLTYIGTLGHPTIHPVFEELAQRARCISIAPPGYTDALEFHDGKLMLGKLQSLADVGPKQIEDQVGWDTFTQMIEQSRFIGMVNWTMLPHLGDLWDKMTKQLFPQLEQQLLNGSGGESGGDSGGGGDRRWVFIDLADPEKRTVQDLQQALKQCTEMNRFVNLILGLNLKEAVQVANALGLALADDPESAIEPLSRSIRDALDLHTVVIHPRGAAAATSRSGGGEEGGEGVGEREGRGEIESAYFAGPFVAQPKISTGAGDHFNAGFCIGLLAGLTLAQSLCVGTATSGYYVRNAASPTLDQLADFCDHLPEPQ